MSRKEGSMEKPLIARTRAWVVALGLSVTGLLVTAQPALAATRPVVAVATGQVISQTFCSPTEVCQDTVISGFATQIGNFVGTQSERINILDGTYTCTATITAAGGDTLTTTCTGQATPLDEEGHVLFVESHQFTGGTGRFLNASGNLQIVGTVDATGQIAAIGVGSLTR